MLNRFAFDFYNIYIFDHIRIVPKATFDFVPIKFRKRKSFLCLERCALERTWDEDSRVFSIEMKKKTEPASVSERKRKWGGYITIGRKRE